MKTYSLNQQKAMIIGALLLAFIPSALLQFGPLLYYVYASGSTVTSPLGLLKLWGTVIAGAIASTIIRLSVIEPLAKKYLIPPLSSRTSEQAWGEIEVAVHRLYRRSQRAFAFVLTGALFFALWILLSALIGGLIKLSFKETPGTLESMVEGAIFTAIAIYAFGKETNRWFYERLYAKEREAEIKAEEERFLPKESDFR